MRPIRLRMAAFGPYSKSVEIDFRKIGFGGGIFLIHGQTGAGKTSILDGLCFAFFGSSSGADRDGESLRSDLAQEDAPTEVTLEFALGPDIYQITRRPRQRLKKKRGDGFTIIAPTAQLSRLAAGSNDDDIDADQEAWLPLASGAQKTDTFVIDLLGMSADQFRQVVVLPQGQFRKFLGAQSDAREKLLETLFRTERHRRIADQLSKRAQELEMWIGSRRQALEAYLQSLEIDAQESLAEKIVAIEDEARSLATATPLIEERFKHASDRKHRAQLAARTTVDLAITQTRLEALEKQRPGIEAARLKLAAERRSRPVLLLDHRALTLERELGELAKERESENTKLTAAEKELGKHQTDRTLLEALTPELDAWRSERTRLLDLWTNATRLKETKSRFAEAERSFQEAETKVREAETLLASSAERRRFLQTEIESHATQGPQADALKARIELANADIAHLSENIKTLEEAEERRRRERDYLERQKATAEDARKTLQKLRFAYHVSKAVQLAQELKTNEPCPVCGSPEHPAPAHHRSEAEPISLEEIEVAEKNEADIAALVTASQTRLEGIETNVRLNEERLLGRFPGASHVLDHARKMREEQTQAISALKMQLDLAEQAARKRESLTNELKKTEDRFSQLELTLRSATKERDSVRAVFDGMRGQVTELEASVPTEHRDPDAIKLRGQELAKKIKERETHLEECVRFFDIASRAEASSRSRLKTLSEQHASKTKELESETASRAKALANSGFATLEECRAAGLKHEEVQEFEELCRKFDAEWTAANRRMSDLKKEAEEIPDWAHDLESRTKELEALDSERAAHRARILSLKEKIALLKNASERLSAQQAEIAQAETRYRSVGRLAAVAQGHLPHNPARVNFSRYVLATRLDEVLEQASRRLYTMSRGQFILKRATGQEDRRRSAGLDLEVEDAFSGTSRATSSLSGGEGFMASLSLALGLADVVQSQLGGVRLETVFVDEGFGTLDSETLELAMKTLTDLQAGGRLVGVISHVPELREQISKRLVVRKSPTGSSVAWEGAIESFASRFT